MSESSQQITNVQLRASVDPGHGGPFLEYRIDTDKDGYRVTLQIYKPFPAQHRTPIPPPLPPSPVPRPLPVSEQNYRNPLQLTEVLEKEPQQSAVASQ